MLPTELLLDPAARLTTVGLFGAAYVALCLTVYRRERERRRRKSTLETAAADSPRWLVAYASQTGEAETLAIATGQRLHHAGLSVQVRELNQLSMDQLRAADRALFVVSTYGEGDPPDGAALFAVHALTERPDLSRLHYAMLALGDDSYQHYCGFGRTLDAWLAECGAQAMQARIEVSRGNAEALSPWHGLLAHLAGSSDAPDWASPAFASWRLTHRKLLNPDSQGAPLYEVALKPAEGECPEWLSGDLVQLCVPGEETRPREYSIASLPREDSVRLLVRLHRDALGRVGLCSGWLSRAPIGSELQLRVKAHRMFRLNENAARPLILIGNGSGLAGLRGHLKARILAGRNDNWLIYGERSAAADSIWGEELEAWQDSGVLMHLDRVFSRDGGAVRYVQDALLCSEGRLREWLAAGAALYICGSLNGMAQGVETALRQLLGEAALNELKQSGRYRRDVY